MTPFANPALALALMLIGSGVLFAQQLPDKDFRPVVAQAAHASGAGATVCVDEAHRNFHTLDNRFWAFGELLRLDGYRTQPSAGAFTAATLGRCQVLVISNAQPLDVDWDQYPYPTPSAFTDEEIEAVARWVGEGGALLLIADHMPLAGAAAPLAARFGVRFLDGFAVERFETEADRAAAFRKPTIFRVEDGTLAAHKVAHGRTKAERVASVRTFTGQAFQAPDAEPLLILPKSFITLMPRRAWQFTADTTRVETGGWLQAAVKTVGKGRAAFFGEAAMFSAQVSGPNRAPMGMNAPLAEQNAQFVLNVLHWLTKIIE